ncbi:MAG: glutamate synthase subunit beta [Lachnospiraceae bacterium]|nr:glutamate synthase subunit beta [Lachnospiraceae bacterium]
MGKTTGFMEYQRIEEECIGVRERIGNFNEFHEHLNEEERKHQAARCMNCGVPMCQSAIKLAGMVTGCPLHNLIPEWNDEIYRGHYSHALTRLLKTSNFPEFTGRVCPALCEKACICGTIEDSVTIHNNELFLIEKAFHDGEMKPRIPAVRSGKKVAVIGSGPSGLAVADQLNHRGHLVTVFERDDRIGGLLMYGIPNMKLQKEVIFRRQQLMEEEGVIFQTSVDIGRDKKASDLLKEFDAVVLCCGAKKARALAVENFETTEGVYYAVDFLKSTTKALIQGGALLQHKVTLENIVPDAYINARDKNVVIVGGGDTGNDCVGTCIRHGCKSVTQIEMMPCPPKERTASNPWPQWPKVLKTDYGQQEAIEVFGYDPRIYETTVKELITKKGKLTGVKTVQVKFENGRLTEQKGTEQVIKCDLLLVAAGFVGCQDYVAQEFGLTLTQRGTVATTTPEKYRSNVDKVFTAGDMHRGQSLVVWAIAEGRACAKEVDEYLMGYSNM